VIPYGINIVQKLKNQKQNENYTIISEFEIWLSRLTIPSFLRIIVVKINGRRPINFKER